MLRIDVGVCTYRRALLLGECLRAIAGQKLPQGWALRVIVADNNAEPLMRDMVARLGAGVDMAYVHAPAANIAVARNACLDAAQGDWLVFIDDDEIAPDDWLARLLDGAGAADIVFGVSEPLMPKLAPRWMQSGAFHANRLAGNDAAHNGYTCNVAMRRAALAGLRFAPALGQTGGEDTLFFHQAAARGLRFGYAPGAVVYEHIPPARATLGWVLRRRFRAGQVHHMLQAGAGRARLAGLATAKLGWCMAAMVLQGWSARRAAWHLARGVFHAGVVAGALGRPLLREYGGGVEAGLVPGV